MTAAGATRDSRRREPAPRWAGILTAAVLGTVIGAYVLFALRTASTTLGCDFAAYYGAVGHWRAGQSIYDLSVASTGSCGTYQYPPPFVLLAAPFGLLPFDLANWAWIAFLFGCWVAGTAILPVRPATRWLVLLLGGIGWPLVFGLRIGQVTPILYVIFAFGWRSLASPTALGGSVAAGALVKLQPALLGVWLLLRRDWAAIRAAILIGLAVVVGAAIVGLWDWVSLVQLLRSLSDALTVPANVAIGARLAGEGVSLGVAGAVQALNTVAMLAIVAVAGLRLSRTSGYLVAAVASQLISPIVWTHYALLLMLPVAWLLDRRQWWIVLVPIAEAWVLLPFLPIWVDTVAFYAVLLGTLAVGWRRRDERDDVVAAPSLAAAGPATAAEA